MDLLLTARWLLPLPGEALEGGVLRVVDGQVAEVLAGEQGRRARDGEGRPALDLGEVVLAPGLVNAHAHLELSGLDDLPRGADFGAWVGAVLERRAGLTEADHSAAVERGARRLLETGTTTVGEVDGTGAAGAVLPGLPLRARIFRELLDGGDPARTPRQLERIALPPPAGGRVLPGLSPHGPHTVSEELQRAAAGQARVAGWPIQVHWAETEAEVQWLRGEGGPLAERLGEAPGCSGLERLERCGLLGPGTSLVHGNHPEAGELERVAAAGASLVHCPGTHAWFERGASPLSAWQASGASVALGTDSRASNDDLDLRLELARAREGDPGLDPAVLWGWATLGGARALGLEGVVGALAPGLRADLVAFDARGIAGPPDLLDHLTGGRPRVHRVWVDGEEVGLVPSDDRG